MGALLVRADHVLLGLRADHKSFAGCWDVIGGHVEAGETPWRALRRELDEELGIDASPGLLLDRLALELAGETATLSVFRVDRWRGEPAIRDDEHRALGWFAPAQAAALPNLALPHYRALLLSLVPRA